MAGFLKSQPLLTPNKALLIC